MNENDPAVINGRRYSLWPQIVTKKQEYIGGQLVSYEDGEEYETAIIDIRFEPNGETSAAFHVDGKEFGCGADVRNLAVDPDLGGNGWLGFAGYAGHRWKIRKAPREMS